LVHIDETIDVSQAFYDKQVSFERINYFTLSEWPENTSTIENWYTARLLEAVLSSRLQGSVAIPLQSDAFVLREFDMAMGSYLSRYFEFCIPGASLERVRKRMLQTESRKINHVQSNVERMVSQLRAGMKPVPSSSHLNYIKNISISSVNEMLRALAEPKPRSIAWIKPKGE